MHRCSINSFFVLKHFPHQTLGTHTPHTSASNHLPVMSVWDAVCSSLTMPYPSSLTGAFNQGFVTRNPIHYLNSHPIKESLPLSKLNGPTVP